MSAAPDLHTSLQDLGRPAEFWQHPHVLMALVTVVSVGVVGGAATLGVTAGAAAVVAVAFGLTLLHRPDLGLIPLVAVAPLVAGLRRGLPVPGLRLSEVIIGGIAVIVLLTADRRRVPRWGMLDWLILLYVAVTALAGALAVERAGAPLTVGLAGDLLGPLQFLILYRAVMLLTPTSAERRRAVVAVLLSALAVAALAIGQLLVPSLATALSGLTDSSAFADTASGGVSRVTGPFQHPQPLSAYLFVAVCLASAILFERTADGGLRRLAALCGLVSALALIATFTLTPILAALLGILILARRAGRLLPALAVVVALAFVASLLFGDAVDRRYQQQFARAPSSDVSPFIPQSLDFRIRVWTEQWFPAMEGRWVSGFGPELPSGVAWAYAESLYLRLAVRGGIPLVLSFLLLAGVVLALAWRAGRAPPSLDRALARALFVMFGLLLAMQLVQAYFLQSGPAHVLWVLIALACSARVPRKAPYARSPEPS